MKDIHKKHMKKLEKLQKKRKEKIKKKEEDEDNAEHFNDIVAEEENVAENTSNKGGKEELICYFYSLYTVLQKGCLTS